MKPRDAALVQFRAQINEDVATTDEAQPRKWRIGCNILPRECADIADVAMDLVAAVALNEETFQSRRRNVFFDRAGINSQPRMFDYRVAQISPENLNAHFGRAPAERFQNANRK